MNTLHTGLDNHILQWNHAWVIYDAQKYPMFQVKVIDHEGLGRRYCLFDERCQQDICMIHVTTRNLTDFLTFIEVHETAIERLVPAH